MKEKKFLIVDDDIRFANLVATKLEKYAQCVIALDGDEALLQFEHHLNEKVPFLAVFMDIEMPKMNGHEVVEKMRSVEKRNHVNPLQMFKLIMLTAHKDVKNVSKSFFRGGAEAYLPKESLADKLVNELRAINIL